MKLSRLLKGLTDATAEGVRDPDVVGITCDSRTVRAGYLFVALPGLHCDGWTFAGEALQRGALAVVTEHAGPLRREGGMIRVPDAALALAQLAAAFYGHPSRQMPVIGITGTNGKTTTAHLAWHILRTAGHVPGLIGTVEYRIGARVIPAVRTTPDAMAFQRTLAEMLSAGCRSAVTEVSSHALVQRRTACTAWDVAVFTNLTRDHLDYHTDMETYFQAKRQLFEALGRDDKQAVAVLNLDDPWGRRLAQETWNARTLTYACGPRADVSADGIRLDSSGSIFRVTTPWGAADIRLGLLGRFNISNALAAVAATGALGVPLEQIVASLQDLDVVPGRLEEVPTGRDFQVFVDYAHTDDALQHVLQTLREITPRRLIVVFGCGGDRDTSKRPAMGAVASRLADHCIVTSDNPRSEDPAAIIAQIVAGMDATDRMDVIQDRSAAIQHAVGMARDGDIVLIAGKGHEHFQEFGNTTVSFDDRQMVKRYIS